MIFWDFDMKRKKNGMFKIVHFEAMFFFWESIFYKLLTVLAYDFWVDCLRVNQYHDRCWFSDCWAPIGMYDNPPRKSLSKPEVQTPTNKFQHFEKRFQNENPFKQNATIFVRKKIVVLNHS